MLDERQRFMHLIQEQRNKEITICFYAATKIQASLRGVTLRNSLWSLTCEAKTRNRTRSKLQSTLSSSSSWALTRHSLTCAWAAHRSESAKAIQIAHRRRTLGKEIQARRHAEAAVSIQHRSRQGRSAAYEQQARAIVEVVLATELIQAVYRRHRTVGQATWRTRRLEAVAALVIQTAVRCYLPHPHAGPPL